jgi:uncharacterized membrane protein
MSRPAPSPITVTVTVVRGFTRAVFAAWYPVPYTSERVSSDGDTLAASTDSGRQLVVRTAGAGTPTRDRPRIPASWAADRPTTASESPADSRRDAAPSPGTRETVRKIRRRSDLIHTDEQGLALYGRPAGAGRPARRGTERQAAMSVIEKSVDVDVPVRMAYNQWTQFESFPRFMEGVRRVDRPQPSLTHWVTSLGGVTREFDAEIVEQRPDERLTWRALDRARHTGSVLFRSLDAARCRLTLRIDFVPNGMLERAGDVLGMIDKRVHGDLQCFKEYIETQGRESGQWRGIISGGHVRPNSGQETPRVPNWPTG